MARGARVRRACRARPARPHGADRPATNPTPHGPGRGGGRAARDLLDRMERIAGPHTRLVMAGGWSEGVAARAVKEAHIGPFERSEAVFMGARGAALTAGRAAGLR